MLSYLSDENANMDAILEENSRLSAANMALILSTVTSCLLPWMSRAASEYDLFSKSAIMGNFFQRIKFLVKFLQAEAGTEIAKHGAIEQSAVKQDRVTAGNS